MPRPCSICSHDERSAIDRALVAGTSFRDVAGQYAVSKSAVARHHADHLPAKLVKAKDAETVAEADRLMGDVVEHAGSILAEVRQLHRRALAILDGAEESKDSATALRAIREARGTLELAAKLEGELSDGPVINLHVNAAWVELRTTVLHALKPYPEARAALAEAIEEGAAHAGD